MSPIGNSLAILESVDSTNNYAMARVHAGLAKHGDTYFALNQTAGKGQRGKTWKSAGSENIILSCVIEPHVFSIDNQFALSTAVALGCYDLVNHYCGDEAAIKWPNDLYWRDRKAGGILIENRIHGNQWQYAVAGIGININQTAFEPGIVNPVSFKQVTGKTFDIIHLAKELCGHLQNRFEGAGDGNLLRDFNTHLYKNEQKVKLKSNNQIFETFIKGVNSRGQLITDNGREKSFNWGEVEWVNG